MLAYVLTDCRYYRLITHTNRSSENRSDKKLSKTFHAIYKVIKVVCVGRLAKLFDTEKKSFSNFFLCVFTPHNGKEAEVFPSAAGEKQCTSCDFPRAPFIIRTGPPQTCHVVMYSRSSDFKAVCFLMFVYPFEFSAGSHEFHASMSTITKSSL